MTGEARRRRRGFLFVRKCVHRAARKEASSPASGGYVRSLREPFVRCTREGVEPRSNYPP